MLEKRFTKLEIYEMINESRLKNIKFSDKSPFWVVVGEKNKQPKF